MTITSSDPGRTPTAVVLLCAAIVMVTGCRREPPAPEQGPTPANETEQRALETFQRHVDDYVAIHRKIEHDLPALRKEATPEQIDKHQRELGHRVAAARPEAKQGDIFTPDMQRLVRDHLVRVFAAKDGQNLKASVMDENPVGITIACNERYPDTVPMATMPPEVLQLMPKMPEGLEYRFIGRHLAIVDVEAHLIADYIPNAIPE